MLWFNGDSGLISIEDRLIGELVKGWLIVDGRGRNISVSGWLYYAGFKYRCG